MSIIPFCRTVKILLLIAVILAGTAIYFAVTSGGEKFRWAGQKIEKLAEDLHKALDKTADKADKARESSRESVEKIKDLKDKLK